MKKEFIKLSQSVYWSKNCEYVIHREYGKTPNGNLLHGAWVLREIKTGRFVDYDRYRNDLFERNRIVF